MKERAPSAVGRMKFALLALFALLICSLALAACGGGDSSTDSSAAGTASEAEAEPASEGSGGGGEAETEAKGEPLVTWTYTDVNTEGAQYKNIEETTRVYQEWINSHGGIGGGPPQPKLCQPRRSPTRAAAGARERPARGAGARRAHLHFHRGAGGRVPRKTH